MDLFLDREGLVETLLHLRNRQLNEIYLLVQIDRLRLELLNGLFNQADSLGEDLADPNEIGVQERVALRLVELILRGRKQRVQALLILQNGLVNRLDGEAVVGIGLHNGLLC